MRDVADRLTHRVQLTSDGHRSYMYGAERAGEARYRPPVCLAANPHPVCGDPDPAHISTSYVERSNLTMRMSMGRFTRLTNAFSNKIDNLKHSVALNFVYYNFCPSPQDAAHHARDGSGISRSRLGIG